MKVYQLALIICISFFWLASESHAQESLVTVEHKRNKIMYDAYHAFVSVLRGEDIEIAASAPCTVTPMMSMKGKKQIEGMESKTSSQTKLIIKIKNRISKKDTTLKFSASMTYTTAGEAMKKLLNKDKNVGLLKTTIDKYAQTSCSAYERVLKENKDVYKTIALLAHLESHDICESELEAAKEEVLKKVNSTLCKDVIQDCKVLVASGTSRNISRAVNMLVSIPPSSACHDEVQEVIELLSQKTDNSSDTYRINEYRTVLSSRDMDRWYKVIGHR